jgi:hypothetical protein
VTQTTGATTTEDKVVAPASAMTTATSMTSILTKPWGRVRQSPEFGVLSPNLAVGPRRIHPKRRLAR